MTNQRDKTTEHPGSERARDEQRPAHGPQYAGGPWQDADKGDAHAPGVADAGPTAADADRDVESGGDRAGMGRGEKPRKPKAEEK